MHPDVVLVECAGDLVGSRGYIVLQCHLTVAFLDKVGLFFFFLLTSSLLFYCFFFFLHEFPWAKPIPPPCRGCFIIFSDY